MLRLIVWIFLKYLVHNVSCMQFVVDGNNGNDENSGQTPLKAFKTIQRCVNELKLGEPGDECQIRSGRYHEEVQVNGLHGTYEKHFTIKGYEDERPIWDGTIPIQPPSWDYDSNTGICSAVIEYDIFALLLDDDLLTPARWPNALWSDKTIFNNTYWSPCDKSSSYGNIVDLDLAESGIDATGAMAVLNIGSWMTYVRPVLSHKSGSPNFTYNHDMGEVPWKPNHNQYYLEAGLSLLDAPEEWVYDNSSNTLYFIPLNGACPDPNSSSLRGRVIDYGLIITDSSFLDISNMTFLASNLDGYSKSKSSTINEINLDSLEFKFASSSHRMLHSIDEPLYTRLSTKYHDNGNKEFGRVSVFNCTFEGSESLALIHIGVGNYIYNNLFIYNDWTGYWTSFDAQGGGDLHGEGNSEITTHNTFWYNGDTNSIRPGGNATVQYNHVVGTCAGKIKNDGAAIQIIVDNQKGSIISYNWIHDTPKHGLRFDTPIPVGTTFGHGGYAGFNVLWDIKQMEIKGDNQRIANNLVMNRDIEDECALCVIYRFLDDPTIMNNQSTVINNGATQADGGKNVDGFPENWPLPGEVVENNYSCKDVREHLIDPDNWDFRPIDGGGFTQGDAVIGPYLPPSQAGNYYWIPGRKLYKTTTPIPPSGAYVAADRDVVMFLGGLLADEHNFYFGTEYANVESATKDDDEFQYIIEDWKGNVMHLPKLLPNTQYFWRVDVQRGGYVFKGDVWNFNTE